MVQDQLNYPEMIDHAMRSVVRETLRRVERDGLPGEHHFYITFHTHHSGAQVSETLKARYPREMTIVLQHQFWDFRVDDDKFQVTLSFGGAPEKLVIPFAALTAFADPSIKFGLQFQQAAANEGGEDLVASPLTYDNEMLLEDSTDESASAEIISLDAFRKK